MTLFDFAPPPNLPFQFQPTLDGQPYSAVVSWSLFGQRWYLNLYDLDGNRIITTPATASPDPLGVNSMAWDNVRRQVSLTTAVPHGFDLGTVGSLTVKGVTPDGFNGVFPMTPTGETTLVYPLNDDPGEVTINGVVGFDLDLVAGYFSTSTLVFRGSSQQFEVSP